MKPLFPTGVPVPAIGKRIDRDSLAPPNIVKAGEPLIIPTPGKQFPLEILQVVHIPETLQVTTPGKNGIPEATVTLARGKVIQANRRPCISANTMEVNKEAWVTMSYMTTKLGLNSHHVYDIFQDHEGNMWFLTSGGGLNRYDGSTFFYITEDEGLINNNVRSMMQDDAGNYWIGTEMGVCKYDGRSFVHYHLEQGFRANIVEAIIEDHQGNIWFGTDAGAIRYDGKQFTHYTTSQGLTDNNVMALLEDRLGNVWIGTYDGGADKFDGKSFTRYTVDEGLSYNRVFDIMEDRGGTLWFGTRIGVCSFDGKRFTHFKTAREFIYGEYNRVRGIVEDQQGNIWFAADGEGVSKLEGQTITQYTSADGLAKDNLIYNLTIDHEGRIWIPAFNHGATCLSEMTVNWDYRDDRAKNNMWLESVNGDRKGNLWFGTFGDGAIRFDGTSFLQYSEAQGLSNSRVMKVIEDQSGVYWMATWEGGICSFDGNSFHQYSLEQGLSDNYVTDIIQDRKGQYWISTLNGGLNLFNGSTFTHFTKENGLLDNNITKLLEDSKGNIWMGTFSKGVSRFDGKWFTHFSKKEGLGANRIEQIHEDAYGNIWFGSLDGGIWIYNGQEFHKLDKNNGLTSNVITSLLQDKSGRLWVGSEQGLDILIPDTINPESLNFEIMHYSRADNFRLTEGAPGYYSDENQIWYNYTSLDLDKFKPSYSAPEIRLNQVDLQQKFIDYNRINDTGYLSRLDFGKALANAFDSVPPYSNYPINLRLPYHINHLTFYFSGIDWSIPRELKYQYKLEGQDETWNPISTSGIADYRNLDHGNYTFTVRAAGFTNTWSDPLKYQFTILPPWWLTWWAYVVYGLLIAGLLYSLRRFEIRRMQYRAEALRLKELDTIKSKLYTNITHEFRTPLTVIMGMADNIKGHEQERSLISRNSKKLLQLINQMLDLSKFDSNAQELNNLQSDIILYLNYLVESFYSLAREKDIRLAFYSEEPSLTMDFDEVKIQHVVYNLLSNAIKFTDEGGKIVLHTREILSDSGPKLQIKVQDTGKGIPQDSLPYIFDRFFQVDASMTREDEGSGIGLALTREYIELMGGNISVKSTLGKGSEFTVTLPITNNAPLLSWGMQNIHKETEHTSQASPPEKGLVQNDAQEKPILLIVEDNRDVVIYIRSIIGEDYQVETAENGQNGLEKAITDIPDIIISDVMMPEMDGYELIQRLKNDERTSHIPVILLTAKAEEDDRLTGLQLGADAYLSKPFNKNELLIRLENLTALRKTLQARYAGMQPTDTEGSVGTIEDEFLRKAREIVNENISNSEFTVMQFCRAAGMSQSQLYRKLMALTGKSPSHFIRSLRLQRASQLLKNTNLNISEVAWKTGFSDPNYFSRAFSQEFGTTPSEWRN